MIGGLSGALLTIPLGLCLGSFATAMVARIPAGKSWIATSSKAERSACPDCGHRLSARDLVPVFSWLFLRGKCRHCGHAIGWQYPAIECATLLMCVAVYAAWGFSAGGIVLMLAVPFIMAMLVIDLRHMILPDQLNVIMFGLGVIFVFFQEEMSFFSSYTLGQFGYAFGASALYFGLAYALAKGGALFLKREALGMGDVKFFAVAGLWLGFMALPDFLLLAGAGGVLLGLIWQFVVKQKLFPFGPALLLAFFLLLLARGPHFSPVVDSFLAGFPGLS